MLIRRKRKNKSVQSNESHVFREKPPLSKYLMSDEEVAEFHKKALNGDIVFLFEEYPDHTIDPCVYHSPEEAKRIRLDIRDKVRRGYYDDSESDEL